MPTDPNAYTKVNLDPSDLLLNRRFHYVPHTIDGFWFRVTAVYPGGGESELSSDGGCAIIGGLGARQTLPSDLGSEGDWRLAQIMPDDTSRGRGSPAPSAGGMLLLDSTEVSGVSMDPTAVATLPRMTNVGYSDGVIQQSGQAETTILSGLPSPHRVIGQGSANPPIKMSFYHLDHLGTPRVITDVAGQPISTHKYLPFGEEYMPPPSTNSHKFTGHERDKETGLDYMLARYYSPAGTFRFASVDPADDSIVPQDPQSWNRYLYAGITLVITPSGS